MLFLLYWFTFPFDNVYELGSSSDLGGCWVTGIASGGCGGKPGGLGETDDLTIDGEGTGGGGGGGRAGDTGPFPNALRAACIAKEWVGFS